MTTDLETSVQHEQRSASGFDETEATQPEDELSGYPFNTHQYFAENPDANERYVRCNSLSEIATPDEITAAVKGLLIAHWPSEPSVQTSVETTINTAIKFMLTLREFRARTYSQHEVIQCATHVGLMAMHEHSPIVYRAKKVKGRTFHAFSIGESTFYLRVDCNGNVYLETGCNLSLHGWCEVKLGDASIRQVPNREISDGLDGLIYGIDLKALHAKGGLGWWICGYNGSSSSDVKIPLCNFTPEQIAAISMECGLPIIPLTKQTLSICAQWDEKVIWADLPEVDAVFGCISPEVLFFHNNIMTTSHLFYASPAFDHLRAWVARNPKGVSIRSTRNSPLLDWLDVARWFNSQTQTGDEGDGK